jgi:hypothetical protein
MFVSSEMIKMLTTAAHLSPSRAAHRQSTFSLGQEIEARYRSKPKWFPGKISRVNDDGSFDISYHDGEKEFGVRETNIQAVEVSPLRQLNIQKQQLQHPITPARSSGMGSPVGFSRPAPLGTVGRLDSVAPKRRPMTP